MKKPAYQVSIYVALGLLCLIVVGLIVRHASKSKPAPVPPKNLGELSESVRDGMSGDWSIKEVPISLQDYVNAKLSEPLDAPQTDVGNNLIQLPEGLHKFGGVAFDVSGTI